MPKPDSSNPNGPSFQGLRYRPNWMAAIVCFIAATYLLVALISYNPTQNHWHSTAPVANNWTGSFGANTVAVLFFSIGVSAIWLLLSLYWMSYVAIRKSRHLVTTRVTSIIIAIISWSGLMAMFSDRTNNYFPDGFGGWAGRF